MKEEDKLLRKLGTENHFKVPENYFENLTTEIMNQLPEHTVPVLQPEKSTTWSKIKPWVYMAAMFIGAAFIIRVASYNPNPFRENEAVLAETDTEYISDEYLDYALTQAMLDDYSLYVYLTDASTD